MDKDEYKALRQKIEDKAKADLAALDRTWAIMTAEWGVAKAPEKPSRAPRLKDPKVKTKDLAHKIYEGLPPHPQVFTRNEAIENLKALDISVGSRDVGYALRSLARSKKIKRIEKGNGSGGPSKFQLIP